MNFRDLPDRSDHPRYEKRLRDIEHLKKQRKERLVEEGMWLDRFTAEDCFWWFCKRFTSFSTYKVAERGHPMNGGLWIDHPYAFWLARLYQEFIDEPQDGWVWVKIHRLGLKTTTLLALCLWIHARWPSKTIGLWTHKVEGIGAGMSRGVLAEIEGNDRLADHFPQFCDMPEATKDGYVVHRPPGPREKSLLISSIVQAVESIHPDIFLFDDVITSKLRGNVDMIAKISKNLSDIAALMTPNSPVICCNTPKDKADPFIAREKAGSFVRVISQAATLGGDFTKVGANLHTAKYYEAQRRDIKDDSIYFAEYELEFRENTSTLFSWSWLQRYPETPEELARRTPYINIIVDGAKGGTHSDFTVIRVITWTAHDRWANLDLIRERIGTSKTMQILLGRDKTDSTTQWIENTYCPGGIGVVEKWMRIDPYLVIWFDEHGNTGWIEVFQEQIRQRRMRFGGRAPQVRKWPEIHRSRTNVNTQERGGYTKMWKIQQLDSTYQEGRVAYPAYDEATGRGGFGHGSVNGLAGKDDRDTIVQFKEDEFERMQLGKLPPYDDMLDSEAVVNMPQAQALMRRPAKGSGYQLGGVEYPAASVSNPFGIAGGGNMVGHDPWEGRTWASI